MDSLSPETAPSVTLIPCNADCRYAAPVQGSFSEWIWCTRPDAPVRVKRAGGDCAWFSAAVAHREDRMR